MIDKFMDDFRFLSNFYPSEIVVDEIRYPTVEHAYQAHKTLLREARIAISCLDSPRLAKMTGRTIPLRPDWEEVKLGIMKQLVTEKFRIPSLRTLLVETGDQLLVEGNTWNDFYWGVCRGRGENHLGKILMEVREEIKSCSR